MAKDGTSRTQVILFAALIVLALTAGFLAYGLVSLSRELSTVREELVSVRQELWMAENSVTFYARCLTKYNGSMVVQGIPENEVNQRGQFSVYYTRKSGEPVLFLDAKGNAIGCDDISVGAMLEVTHSGLVRLTHPGHIVDTHMVQLRN